MRRATLVDAGSGQEIQEKGTNNKIRQKPKTTTKITVFWRITSNPSALICL